MTERDDEVRVDPTDGLPATPVGAWAKEKHRWLEMYIRICRATRAKFVGRAGVTYIDPYCAAGRAYVRGTDEFIDGSPLVAWKAARVGNAAFTSMLLNDQDPALAEAAKHRLGALHAPVTAHSGEAAAFIDLVASQLDPYALHLVFIDPFNLVIPFSMLEKLAAFRYVDVLIHVSAMELQRNWPAYSGRATSPLDVLNPGWRARVNTQQSHESARQAFVYDWIAQLKKLGFKGDVEFKLVTGSMNQPLYWLVLVTKHEIATKFWKSVLQPGRTRPLF